LPQALVIALEAIGTDNPQGKIRRLTPTECERLMGWPDGWTISQSYRSHRASAATPM
jgi:site-specific DNA-cytosine methylase